jgi:hypothetical protein
MPDWDEDKRAANLAKHGDDFADVARFDWTGAIRLPDTRRDYGEVREGVYGLIGDRLHFLVFTLRDGRMRIISLRRASEREQRLWTTREK